MLHIAPEYEFEVKLRKVPGLDYLTSDLNNPRAMVKMDITAIEYPDDYFDVIYCSHVLEHVHDDRKAMRELNRVLNIDGWGVFMVPITSKKTFGDSSVTNPSERERRFGQSDHVRVYGTDFRDRLEEEGFSVTCFTGPGVVGDDNIIKFGLKDDIVFFVKKN